MKKHQLASYRKQFPGINYIGLSEDELLGSTLKVCVADDTLMSAKATWEESGDGRFTDFQFKERAYYGFGKINPKKDSSILLMGLSQHDEMARDSSSVGPNGQSKGTVASLFTGAVKLVVIIEVYRDTWQLGQFAHIRIHKVKPGFKAKRSE